MELSFPRTFGFLRLRSQERKLHGTFAPWNIRSPYVPIQETYNRRSQHKRMQFIANKRRTPKPCCRPVQTRSSYVGWHGIDKLQL